MFIDRMLNQGSEPLLEQWLKFTSQRHKLIAEDVVNLSTPNYRQKDLSLEKFQAMLRDRVDRHATASPDATGGTDGSDGSESPANFDSVAAELEEPEKGMLFHDGANRSAEQLMTDQAKNAMMHNLAIELLHKQFQQLDMAIKERPG